MDKSFTNTGTTGAARRMAGNRQVGPQQTINQETIFRTFEDCHESLHVVGQGPQIIH